MKQIHDCENYTVIMNRNKIHVKDKKNMNRIIFRAEKISGRVVVRQDENTPEYIKCKVREKLKHDSPIIVCNK